jgi:predicted transcriptional regulator
VETKNSERFLSAFNSIHDYIKIQLEKRDQYVKFVDGVNILRKRNYILNRYYDDLILFNKLRNVIVHEKYQVEFVIAEPHEEIVHKIENIMKDLVQPETVFPRFNKTVRGFNSGDFLIEVLKAVKEKGFSQFPVYNKGKFKGLLTENGITNWLSRSLLKDTCFLSETKIEDVLGFEEKENNFLFISRNLSVFEAKAKFLDHLNHGTGRIDALLITENGKPHESLLGIITAWDIIDI